MNMLTDFFYWLNRGYAIEKNTKKKYSTIASPPMEFYRPLKGEIAVTFLLKVRMLNLGKLVMVFSFYTPTIWVQIHIAI